MFINPFLEIDWSQHGRHTARKVSVSPGQMTSMKSPFEKDTLAVIPPVRMTIPGSIRFPSFARSFASATTESKGSPNTAAGAPVLSIVRSFSQTPRRETPKAGRPDYPGLKESQKPRYCPQPHPEA